MPQREPPLVGKTKDGRASVYHGGATVLMEHLRATNQRFNLIYGDPPFNINRDYGKGIRDDLPHERYHEWTKRWLDAAIAITKPSGAIVVNVYDNIAAEIVCHMKARKMHLVRWVIWHYRFGQCQAGNFIQSHQHCLIFCRDPAHPNLDISGVLEPSDRASKYGDRRTLNKKQGVDGMRPPLDVWQGEGFSRVTGNSGERWKSRFRPTGHDNQLPIRYLKRIVTSLTKPGDSVLDPFVGSGTTALVAYAMNRVAVGGDLSKASSASAMLRIRSGAQQNLVLESPA